MHCCYATLAYCNNTIQLEWIMELGAGNMEVYEYTYRMLKVESSIRDFLFKVGTWRYIGYMRLIHV